MSERQFEKNDEAERAHKSATTNEHTRHVEMGKMKRWDKSSEKKTPRVKGRCSHACRYVSLTNKMVRECVESHYLYDTIFAVSKRLMDESWEIVENGYSSHMEKLLLKELYKKNEQLREFAYGFLIDMERVGTTIARRLSEMGDKELVTEWGEW